jgi:predicted DNA-binding ribbon-helix-helix protein
VKIDGRKSGVTPEDEFWNALKQIAADQSVSIERLVLRIDSAREQSNLSSANRLFVLDYYRQHDTDDSRKA